MVQLQIPPLMLGPVPAPSSHSASCCGTFGLPANFCAFVHDAAAVATALIGGEVRASIECFIVCRVWRASRTRST